MHQKKILIVEDDLNLGFLLLNFLEAEGFKIKLCRDGRSGLEEVQNQVFDLCILDVMMPKLDGFTVAKILRKKGIQTPFIFLTAKSMKEDRLNGYAIGADDYITKPFDEEELLCKINVILRRQKKDPFENIPSPFRIGEYAFHHDRHELVFKESNFRLTEKEAEILKMLCIQLNRVLKRDEALMHIYGRCDYFQGRSFDVYISRLRKLLKLDSSIEIQNVYKVGFILNVGARQVSQ